jgi:hypothetical protein
VQLEKRIPDPAVLDDEEIIGMQERRDAENGLWVNQDRAEDGFFGLDIVGSHADTFGGASFWHRVHSPLPN